MTKGTANIIASRNCSFNPVMSTSEIYFCFFAPMQFAAIAVTPFCKPSVIKENSIQILNPIEITVICSRPRFARKSINTAQAAVAIICPTVFGKPILIHLMNKSLLKCHTCV